VVDLVELPTFRVRLEPESPPTPSRSTSSYAPLYSPNNNDGATVDDVVNSDRIEAFEFEFLPSPVEPEDQREAAPIVPHHQPSDNLEPETRVEDNTDTDKFSKLFAAIRTESEKMKGKALKAQSEQLNRAANARRALETAVLKEKVVNAERKASKWNTEKSALKTELQEANRSATRLSGDNAVLRKNLTSAQNGIEALKKNLQDSGRMNGQLTNDNFVLEGKLEEMRKASEFKQGQLGIDKLILEKELEDMKKEMGELPDKVKALQLRLADTQTRLEGAQVFRADAESRLQLANTRLQEQSNELTNLTHELDTMRDRLQTQAKDSHLLEKQHEMSENYIKELRQEMRRKIAAARKKGEAEGRDKAIEDMGRQHIRTLEVVQNERSGETKIYSLQECGTQTSFNSSREYGTQTTANSPRDSDTQTSVSSLQESGTQTLACSLRNSGMQTSASSLKDYGTQTETSDTATVRILTLYYFNTNIITD
jgi:predicted  nucleic acid-binding Zn-ribbon protein